MTMRNILKKMDPIHAHHAWNSSSALQNVTRADQRVRSEHNTGDRFSVAKATFALQTQRGVYAGNRVADAFCWLTGEGALPSYARGVVPTRYKQPWGHELKSGVLAWAVTYPAAVLCLQTYGWTAVLAGAAIGGLTAPKGHRMLGMSCGFLAGMALNFAVSAVIGKAVAVATGYVGLGVRATCRGAGYALGTIYGGAAACVAAASYKSPFELQAAY